MESAKDRLDEIGKIKERLKLIRKHMFWLQAKEDGEMWRIWLSQYVKAFGKYIEATEKETKKRETRSRSNRNSD